MIRVVIERANIDKSDGTADGAAGFIRLIRVDGHAGFAGRGSDIVCAAASATIYTAAGALCEICGADVSCADERSGHFLLTVPGFKDEQTTRDAQVIMETARIGFLQIEGSYSGHLTVEEVVAI